MKNPLESVTGTIISGLILTVVLVFFLKNFLVAGVNMELMSGLARWIHLLAGITWIGLLYYFNLVQMAALKDAAADGTAAGITKHVAPRALVVVPLGGSGYMASRRSFIGRWLYGCLYVAQWHGSYWYWCLARHDYVV